MSVLNQSGEEQVECPLCMEPLEVDDLNFFPCTCGYQICRFCWHRIRTDENGLCPACRKAYSENPADFIPLSKEQVAKLKAEKRQKDQQRKAKQSESRKHLASVRVVQKNLVFVVGLPMRLADPEILKRHEYFGKFGKIHKVVINQSTSYAGSQGPSASAYVTYMKSDDALRAIQNVNNITIDGRIIKSSLGTTKYCSHFLKNQPCPKPDCMYLHDYDPEASFTKEEMHLGKHQEYEKKLHENLLMRASNNNNQPVSESKGVPIPTSNLTTGSCSPKESTSISSSVSSCSSTATNSGTNKENWPNLNNIEKEKKDKDKVKKNKAKYSAENKRDRKECHSGNVKSETRPDSCSCSTSKEEKSSAPFHEQSESMTSSRIDSQLHQIPKLPSLIDDNTSFFSLHSFQKLSSVHLEERNNEPENETTHPSLLTDTLPNINTSEDWAAAFGFRQTQITDDLGIEQCNNGLYLSSKENIIEVLSKRKNGYTGYSQEPPSPKPPVHNSLNSLDQNMSKFFMDFHKNSKKLNPNGPQELHNGLNGIHQNYYSGLQNNTDRIMLQQKQLEEQLLKLSLKQGFGNGSSSLYPNGVNPPSSYLNGESRNYANLGGHSYENINMKPNIKNSEDDLGFDPFQETQKAFAELMASEQNHKIHNTGHSQINGIIHNNGSHIPPPPPGFIQSSTHMNSFGSKILPFLNMSSNQQPQQQQPQQQQQQHQQINNSTQNNWPSIFNSQLQQPPPPQQLQKSPSNTCNDWKVLDPAILSSSRHFPLANLSPIRDHYPNITQLGTQQIPNGPPLRSYEFANNAFSNFSHQLQPNFNNFTLLNPQQNISWYSSDPNSQISSPPGFMNNQATKQQEC